MYINFGVHSSLCQLPSTSLLCSLSSQKLQSLSLLPATMKRMNSRPNASTNKPSNSEYIKRIGNDEVTKSYDMAKESFPLTSWERPYLYPQTNARAAGKDVTPWRPRPQYTAMGVHDQKEYFHGFSSGLWSTGYFTELRSGSGELWQKRSVWGSQKGMFNRDYRQ